MTDRIQKALRKISTKERLAIERIISCIFREELAHLDIQKLQGREDVYRVRKGDLRIIFQKTKLEIRILAIERRGDTTYTKILTMSSVRKAIIPVAGFGTRFLPVTKAMPKEMLPIIDKPVIQHVVEEAVASGITDIILVTSSSKRAVEDHFDDNPILEAWLKKSGKTRALEEIRAIGKMANFIYVRQKGPYGNATPVLNCRHLIGDEPFAVLFGDEILVGKKPRLRQMIEVYEKYGDPVLGAIEVTREETKKYGILDPAAEVERGVYQLKGMVEKPGPERAPSRLASIGAFVLTPDIFASIKQTKRGHEGEIVLLDAIRNLMKTRPIYAKKIEGAFYDTGSKIGWLRANIEMALAREDMAKETRMLLNTLAKKKRNVVSHIKTHSLS